MRRSAALVFLLVSIALASPPVILRGAEDGSFTLAVLRRDGVVIPFATFNAGRVTLFERGRWENRWPVTGKPVEIPLQLSDVPGDWWFGEGPITRWTAWPLQGEKIEVVSQAPVTVIAQCQLGLGIRTSYRSAQPAPPEMEQPYPKDGLATAGDVTVDRPPLLEASSPEWRAVHETVVSEVTDLEGPLLIGQHAGTKERAATPFAPELIVRVTPDALYFEGIKSYPPLTPVLTRGFGRVPNRCNTLTYAAGWVLRDKGKWKVQASADVTDCDREGLVYSLPLGLIRRGDTTVSVVQVSGWGYERYEVLEVREGRVKSVISTPGGWCQ